MNSSILTQYSNEVPEEIKLLLNGLSDEKSLGILIVLLKNGKMTFNELKEKFQLSSSSLSNFLTRLQDGNLITNFYEKSGARSFSYYDVTEIPEQVFDSLFDIMYPSTKKTKESDEEKQQIYYARDWIKTTKFEYQYKEPSREKFESITVGKKNIIGKNIHYQMSKIISSQQVASTLAD